jgi:exonuclease SbcD
MLTLLHFADAHIDMANYGRHDAESGLPLRVLDFLKSMDAIVDTAVNEKVNLVIFAGDAYKDRSPAPTFQREWQRRIARLARAGIPTLLLVGNHDISPTAGRAHTIQEFETLGVPHVHVLDKPAFLGPEDLEGLPLQVIALPWVGRAGLMAALEMSGTDLTQVYQEIEVRLTELVHTWIEAADPQLPLVLTAHASVQGAVYGGERTVMLGADLVLPGSLLRDSRLDYVALGHIHKAQDLNDGAYPPVVYPGSIERVDFGEVNDDKFFVVAHVERGKTNFEWRKLSSIRPFSDCRVSIDSDQDVTERLLNALPPREKIEGAIVRLTVDYPFNLEAMLDETAVRDAAAGAFEFHLVKRPKAEARIRLPQDASMASLTPLDLLQKYWDANHTDTEESRALQDLAKQVIQDIAGANHED